MYASPHFSDNILVMGINERQLAEFLLEVLYRNSTVGPTVRRDKYGFSVSTDEFLAFMALLSTQLHSC